MSSLVQQSLGQTPANQKGFVVVPQIALMNEPSSGNELIKHAGFGQIQAASSIPQNALLSSQSATTWHKRIPSTTVGIVIGQQGATINKIRMQSGCAKIHIEREDNQTGQRSVTFIGTYEQHLKAVALIEDILAEHKAKLNEMQAKMREAEGHIKFQFVVPQRLVGLVIGTKGATIKSFNKITGANLRLPEDMQLPDGSRTMIITGEPAIATEARNYVLKFLHQEDPEFTEDLALSLGVVLEKEVGIDNDGGSKSNATTIPDEIGLLHTLLERSQLILPPDAMAVFATTFYETIVSHYGNIEIIVEELRKMEKANRLEPTVGSSTMETDLELPMPPVSDIIVMDGSLPMPPL